MAFARVALALALLATVPVLAEGGRHSKLWGTEGRRFRDDGPLPDFSWAGYRQGQGPLPATAPVANVRDFGARGDGRSDDAAAFQRALAEAPAGVLLVPRGRYRLSGVLRITRSGLVLRGEGAGAGGTALLFTSSLADLRHLTELPTSNTLSWSGGLIEIEPEGSERRLSGVVMPVRRGERRLQLATTRGIQAGDVLFLRLSEDPQGSLERHLVGGTSEPERGNPSCASRVFDWTVQVAEVEGDGVLLNQPLRTDVRPEWQPWVWRMPTVREVGIEHLAIEFPVTPYSGHHRERGLNAVELARNVVDGWVRDVTIANADSGVFVGRRSKWLTITGLRFTSTRPADRDGNRAHHGVVLSACSDVLVSDLDFRVDFIHEVTIGHRANGNVLSGPVIGANVDLDHHRDAPFENLFQDLQGRVRMQAGGNKCQGPPAGVRNTYWGVDGLVELPPWLGAGAVVVGATARESRTQPGSAAWLEAVAPLEPRDLRAAQWQRRQAGATDSARPAGHAGTRPRP